MIKGNREGRERRREEDVQERDRKEWNKTREK